jgi:ribosome recycling factor
MIEDTLQNTDKKMRKATEVLGGDLAAIRTGRATPALVEHIKVEYYGVPTPLNQIAGISTPEARLLIIQPWDRKALASIEKSILKSDLGLTPTSQGDAIWLTIPQLTEERRRDLVKVVHKRVEEGKIALRNLRREAVEEFREMERNKDISQDEHKRASVQLQRLTDSFIGEVEQIEKQKEAEIMED